MHIKKLLLKQYNIPVIGHAKLSVTYSMLYINAITNISSMAILYTTTIDHHMYVKFGWSIGILPFMTLYSFAVVVLVLIVRKFEQAGTMGVNMDQQLEFSKEWNEFKQMMIEIHQQPNRRLRKELRYAAR